MESIKSDMLDFQLQCFTRDPYLYPTEAILQRHLQCNKSDIRQVLGNNYLLGSYSPVQYLIW